MAGASTTIVIADPYPVVRAGIRCFCKTQGLRVVGECGSFSRLIDLVVSKRPKCAIIDPAIANTDFEHLMRRIAAAGPGTRVLVHGASDDRALVRSMLSAGASGYLLKNGPAAQLIEAVVRLDRGETYVTPLINCSGETEKGIDPRTILSEREYQVFLALGAGERPRDLARSLGLSPKTVDTYRANILRKLNLDGMAALVRRATGTPRDESRARRRSGPY